MPPIKIIVGRKLGGTDTAPASPVPVSTQQTDPRWITGEIDLSVENADGTYSQVKVQAEIFSVFAINKSITRKGTVPVTPGHTLTHIPTGLDVALMDDKEDCRRMAAVLLHHCKKAFYSSSMKETRALVPQTVIDWIKACKEVRNFLDPVDRIVNYTP